VFAANWWDIGNGSSFVNAAFNMYLNYDGAGGQFGDVSEDADTSNIANSAVYASVDSTDPNRMVVVAINRTANSQTTGIAVTHDRVFDHAEVYQLTSGTGSSPLTTHAADIELNLVNAFQFTMPAWSVSTLVLISDGLPGDYNRDGSVDLADFVVWRKLAGQTGDLAADGNEDNIVDTDDYTLWRGNFGRSATDPVQESTAAVPEPVSLSLVLVASIVGLVPRRQIATRRS